MGVYADKFYSSPFTFKLYLILIGYITVFNSVLYLYNQDLNY